MGYYPTLPYFRLQEALFSAVLYNALGFPIATGLLYLFFGVMLRRMIAGAAMSLNSVSVISKRLWRKLARQFYPDVAKDKKGAEEKLKPASSL